MTALEIKAIEKCIEIANKVDLFPAYKAVSSYLNETIGDPVSAIKFDEKKLLDNLQKEHAIVSSQIRELKSWLETMIKPAQP